MRRSVNWPIGLALVVFSAGCQQSQSAELSQQDVTAIKANTGTWTKAQLAADWAAMDGLFADNVSLFPPNLPAVEGKGATMNFLKGFPKLTAFTAISADVGGRGDVAYDRGIYSFTTAPAPGAPSTSERGTYLAIEQKQADGSWKVTRDIWHSDSPAGAPAPAKK